MGADYIIHYSCRPKEALGEGDVVAGSVEMVRLLKAGNMARVFEEQARKEGKDPSSLSVVRQERNVATGEVVNRPLTYLTLREEEERLTPLAPDCANCPVNLFADSFGCTAALRYPVSARSEEWLMNRLQPPSTPGGFLCRKAIADFHYDGAPIQRWREGKLFELPQPIERALDPDHPDQKINSNQVWQALLAVGNELKPFHCLYVPLWVGVVRLDGDVPSEPEHLMAITRLLTFESREERTTFDAGSTDQGPEIFGVQKLLFACYNAWLHDVPLLMDA